MLRLQVFWPPRLAPYPKYGGSFIIPVFILPDNDLSALEFMSQLSLDGIVFDVTDLDTLSSLQGRLIDQVSCS